MSVAGTSHSQNGQDVVLANDVFARKRKGVFVDVGAHDGVTFSNTLMLERDFDWSGVCIEPLPSAA